VACQIGAKFRRLGNFLMAFLQFLPGANIPTFIIFSDAAKYFAHTLASGWPDEFAGKSSQLVAQPVFRQN
jgi:hypothetical protein